jgi:hypothetical protein
MPRPNGGFREEGLMLRPLTTLSLFLLASIGFAGPALAQYGTQYYPGNYPTNPNTYQANPGTYQANPGAYPSNPNTYQTSPNAQGSYQTPQGTYQGNQGYQGNTGQGYNQGGNQGNQAACPYGQQFDPRQGRCAPVAASIPTCPAGQQFDQGQNRCVYALPGGVTVPGTITR